MGQKVVTMEMKYAAMFAAVQSGAESVSQVCDRVGISRKSYYKYRARFEAEGLDGLRPRSRRPTRSPHQTPPEMVELILVARDKLAEEGWDNGALSVRNRLLREGEVPPSWRTIHRVLVRAGVVVPQPQKRSRSSRRRFEFPAPEDCWQMDGFDTCLADGQPATVFEIKDDCSRTQVANLAWPGEETIGAWECVARGIDDFGCPRLFLTDNSLAFSGKLHHTVVLLEKNLIKLGIKPITSRPWHPQTCGKNERGHQTLQKWLRARPVPASLAELQALLDSYQSEYNNRPHQGLDVNQTPLERRIAATRPRPPRSVHEPMIVRHVKVRARGYIGWDGCEIAIGRQLVGRTLLVFATGDDLIIFYRHLLVRELTLDRTRRYQSRPAPRRRDYNTAQLLLEFDSAARERAGLPACPQSQPAGATEAPGQEQPTAVAQRSRQRPLRRRMAPT